MKRLLIVTIVALSLCACKEEPKTNPDIPERSNEERVTATLEAMEEEIETERQEALADYSNPWGVAKVEQLTQDLQTGKCRIRLSPERMIPEQENLPDDTPLCLPDGLEIGDFFTSPFAAFVTAMSTLSAEERYIGVCLKGAWKLGERVDRLFRTDEKESCNRVGGFWLNFREVAVALSQPMEAL